MRLSPLPHPPTGAIDVWPVALAECTHAAVRLLAPEERSRADRRSGEARRRFIASHAALRRVVAAYGRRTAHAGDVVAAYGRPPRAGCGLELSLTHCGDLALVGVATAPVGVDVESVLADADPDHVADLAEMTLGDEEFQRFRMTPWPMQQTMWVRLFVRKEACLKAQGHGLADAGLTDIDALDDETTERSLRDLAIGSDHVAAVALRSPITAIRWREL